MNELRYTEFQLFEEITEIQDRLWQKCGKSVQITEIKVDRKIVHTNLHYIETDFNPVKVSSLQEQEEQTCRHPGMGYPYKCAKCGEIVSEKPPTKAKNYYGSITDDTTTPPKIEPLTPTGNPSETFGNMYNKINELVERHNQLASKKE
jgi:hypothetical protein